MSLPVTVYDHSTGRLVPGGIWAGDEVGRRGGSVCSIAWHPTIPVFALGLSDGRVLLHTSQLFVADDIPPALRDEFEELIEEGDDDEWSGMWTRRAPLACVESRGSMKGGGRIREATCVEFSRDGTLLATGYVDGIITVSSIRIHKRDKYVTRADEMQIMRVWESSIDFGAVMSLCWDAKCRFLAAGSEDDAVTIFYNPTTPPSPPSPTSSSPPAQRSPLATTGNRMTKSPKMAKRKSAEDDGKKRNKKVKGAVGAAGEQKDTLGRAVWRVGEREGEG
ncbi:hypothetical protein BC938DRAFT_480483 [Jimgerdemannia flammicorona]|uniref:WD40-repeat-containing domain protein n=1 Tax=Jimgerdemannia flammicorona TaxID=994334 RepID=A0A433QID0_9FUNG|nr:hypothetical protein BC938DRAFT_480483 [Jimgerdemannia flammicorona]